MQITFSLSLPREAASVPVVRRLCTAALKRLGVREDCIADIEIAVTEACTNVVKHAAASTHEYEVDVCIGQTSCDIRVIDESGRGLFLMRSLVDELHFAADPEVGLAVELVKSLKLEDDALLRRVATSAREAGGGDSLSP